MYISHSDTAQLDLDAGGDGQHVIKVESNSGKSGFLTTSISNDQPSSVAKARVVTQLQSNNIKRIFQTPSGQLIIIPSNGGQTLLPGTVFTQARILTTASRPLISTPTPIPVAKVTDSSAVHASIKAVPSATSGARQSIEVMHTESETSSEVNQVQKDADERVLPNSEHTSYVLYNDGSGDHAQVPSGGSVNLVTPQFVTENSSAINNVTYIQTVDSSGNKQIQVASNVIKSPSKSPALVIASNQLQMQPSLVSQAQLIAHSMVGLAPSSNQNLIADVEQLEDGTQIFVPKVIAIYLLTLILFMVDFVNDCCTIYIQQCSNLVMLQCRPKLRLFLFLP